MLRNISPILSPGLLYTLRAMGHGDEVVIVDANFPAESSGPKCFRLDGVSATETLRAILDIMPLDTFTSAPALTMQVVGDPNSVPNISSDFQLIINEAADHPAKLRSIERFDFYKRACSAYAIVQTGEQQLYGNIILKKGIIEP